MTLETTKALDRLLEGNQRFVEGRSQLHSMTTYGVEVAAGQSPFAVVLGCSDSRVPVETIFDQEPGKIFVIRVAGNIVNDDGLGSIEYAVDLFKAPLVLVLGHSGCGAVAAAIQQVERGTHFPGHIARLVSTIAPAAASTRHLPDAYDAAIAENVRRNVVELTSRSPLLAEAAGSGNVAIAGAVYDLKTGKVSLID